jgi:endonuclease VIII-like 1
MPELAELRIMQDYINHHSKKRKFTKLYHVQKGNIPIDSELIEDFEVIAESFGKELQLKTTNDTKTLDFSVFMGMSGNWKFVPTENWNDTKFVRMRIDTDDGNSLLLYGSYMGPRYRLGAFTGVKRGPDPTKEFDKFKSNVLDNLKLKAFDKPICEVLLNQKYFNGIGNYLRSTILYYINVNPFESARTIILENPDILDFCRDVPIKAYTLNGGQLTDWTNPFDSDYEEFKKWVFYQKGLSCRDNTGRTFWYDEKWDSYSIYKSKTK